MNKIFAIIVLLFTTGLASSQNLPPPVDIPIADIKQETNEWCWVAVTQQIVNARFGNSPMQCALVEAGYNAPPGFCCSAYNQQCIKGGTLGQISNLIAQFGGLPSHYSPPASAMALYNTLAAGKPVILQLNSGGGNLHVVVVRGMEWNMTPNGPRAIVYVNDPMLPVSTPMPFDYIAQSWIGAIVVD